MHKTMFIFASALMICSCNTIEDQKSDETAFIRLYAEVGIKSSSRTVTETDGKSYFVENDCIGLFIPGNDIAGKWKYDGYNWNSSSTAIWDNREESFDFCAFYPCTSDNISKDAVVMPDLSLQTGNFIDIGEKDFLIGRCTASYTDNNGVVSFSGENSFSHAYSLLHLNIVDDGNNANALITGCEFIGEGIVRKHKYVFGDNPEEDRPVSLETSGGSNLKIDYSSPFPIESSHEIAILLNPVSLTKPLEFSLYYKEGDELHVAKVELLKDINQGSYNKIKLNWVKDKLNISGNEVSDWNISNLDDILLQ